MGPPLTVLHVDSETGFSGGEVQVFLLIEGLRARGHHAVLVCPPDSGSAREAARRDIEVRTVRMRNDWDLGAVRSLARAIDAVEPHVVHLHTGRATWLGALAARRAGRPALSTRRQDRRVRRGWRTRWLYGSLVRRVAAISPAVVDRLRRGGVPAERIELVSSSVDPLSVLPERGRDALRAELGAGPDDAVMLTLGALVPRKGIDVLLDALARLSTRRPWRLWIAGDGPAAADLRRRIARLDLGERVRLLGARGDKGDLLAACDLFVHPARAEGLGVAALEAMAAGRAVVASRAGGLAHSVVEGRVGLLVPPGDAHALRAALARLVDQPELLAMLGRNGPDRVAEGFLPDQMVDAYERLYREILAEERA